MTVEQLEEERDMLRRELIGCQEMLAFVLKVAGPVTVTKEMLKQGLPQGAAISIDDQLTADAFVFSLQEPDDAK
jgi:hypothetical protein